MRQLVEERVVACRDSQGWSGLDSKETDRSVEILGGEGISSRVRFAQQISDAEYLIEYSYHRNLRDRSVRWDVGLIVNMAGFVSQRRFCQMREECDSQIV